MPARPFAALFAVIKSAIPRSLAALLLAACLGSCTAAENADETSSPDAATGDAAPSWQENAGGAARPAAAASADETAPVEPTPTADAALAAVSASDSEPDPATTKVEAELQAAKEALAATQAGTPEFAKAQKAAIKAERAAAKQRAKLVRAAAAVEIRAAKEREKKRRADEKDLSKEDRENWAIREAAFRHLLTVEGPGEIVFLSFTPLDSVNMKWNDPPEGFLPRLMDLPVQLRPANQAILTREPVADIERPNRMVQDPVTKNAGSIYWADLLKASKDGEVRVDAGCFRGFLKSWGCILIMEKQRGVWRVKAQTAVWKT